MGKVNVGTLSPLEPCGTFATHALNTLPVTQHGRRDFITGEVWILEGNFHLRSGFACFPARQYFEKAVALRKVRHFCCDRIPRYVTDSTQSGELFINLTPIQTLPRILRRANAG